MPTISTSEPLLRFAAAAVAATVLAACGSPTAPGPDVHVSATVDRETVRTGETVAVAIVIANDTGRPQRILSAYCGDPFVVFDAAGVPLPARVVICAAITGTSQTVPPGETYTSRGTWRAAVAPGRYTVRGWIHRSDRGDGAAAAVTVTP